MRRRCIGVVERRGRGSASIQKTLMATSCISAEQMALFLSGELSADDESVVSAHLQQCTACDRVARAMSQAPVADEMQAIAVGAGGEQSQESLGELKGRLRALAYIGGGDGPPADGGSRATLTGGDTERSVAHVSSPPITRRLGKFEII